VGIPGWSHHDTQMPKIPMPKSQTEEAAYFVDEEYLVTALVPSETACLASSPGRMRRTLQSGLAAHREAGSHVVTHEVWISREEMVDFLL
jgi:hypothetical protein